MKWEQLAYSTAIDLYKSAEAPSVTQLFQFPYNGIQATLK